jgi:hypothetical protein
MYKSEINDEIKILLNKSDIDIINTIFISKGNGLSEAGKNILQKRYVDRQFYSSIIGAVIAFFVLMVTIAKLFI